MPAEEKINKICMLRQTLELEELRWLPFLMGLRENFGCVKVAKEREFCLGIS